jgi:hypothetical protein
VERPAAMAQPASLHNNSAPSAIQATSFSGLLTLQQYPNNREED